MLARSEQSAISEPRVEPESAGAQSVTHQSLLDVSQAILQHRDLERAVPRSRSAFAHHSSLRLPQSGSARRGQQYHAAAYPGKRHGRGARRAGDGVSARGFAFRMGLPAPGDASDSRRRPGNPLAQDHGSAQAEPRDQFLLVAADYRPASAGRANVWVQIGRAA